MERVSYFMQQVLEKKILSTTNFRKDYSHSPILSILFIINFYMQDKFCITIRTAHVNVVMVEIGRSCCVLPDTLSRLVDKHTSSGDIQGWVHPTIHQYVTHPFSAASILVFLIGGHNEDNHFSETGIT